MGCGRCRGRRGFDILAREALGFMTQQTIEVPPLPLIDGALFIDNSTLEYLTTCPRAFQFKALHKRISAESRPALNFGGAIHTALEVRYRMAGNEPVDEAVEFAQVDALERHFAERPIDDNYRTLDLAYHIVRKYNSQYISEPFEILANEADGKPLVELSFAHKLGDFRYRDDSLPVFYMGRIDLLVWWPKGHLFVVDHKTTSIMGQGFFEEQRMSAQQHGYLWAAQKSTGLRAEGFAINAIRTRPPAKTRAAVETDDFQREKYFIAPEAIVEWEYNVTALIDEMLWHHARGYFPMKTKWCVGKYGRCPYFEICSLPPESRGLMLNTNMFTTDTWSPLQGVMEKPR